VAVGTAYSGSPDYRNRLVFIVGIETGDFMQDGECKVFNPQVEKSFHGFRIIG
jgi:hypothetical protein